MGPRIITEAGWETALKRRVIGCGRELTRFPYYPLPSPLVFHSHFLRSTLLHSTLHHAMSFRQAQRDPLLLVSQIVCFQAAFYTFNSVAVMCAEAYTNADMTLDHVLSPTEFRGDTVLGWSLALCWLISSGFG
jgi:hypothetical protein